MPVKKDYSCFVQNATIRSIQLLVVIRKSHVYEHFFIQKTRTERNERRKITNTCRVKKWPPRKCYFGNMQWHNFRLRGISPHQIRIHNFKVHMEKLARVLAESECGYALKEGTQTSRIVLEEVDRPLPLCTETKEKSISTSERIDGRRWAK